MKFKLLVVMLLALTFLCGAGSAHAQTTRAFGAVGWCNQEDCDNQYQDEGSANCSLFQVIVTQQTLRDSAGRAFATGYALNSYDTTNGTPCYAAWDAFTWAYSENVSWGSPWIGTLNTQVYTGGNPTINNGTEWVSTRMLSGDDLYQNRCISGWLSGSDDYNGTYATFNIKLIGGGSNC